MSIQTVARTSKPIALRVRNRKNEPSDHPMQRFEKNRSARKSIDDTQIAVFGRLLYEKLKDDSSLSREQIAKIINKCTEGKEVTVGMVSAWISRARLFFIKEYNETIIWTRVGLDVVYRIAKGYEKPLRVAKLGYMVLKTRDRFFLESTILNAADMKLAGSALVKRMQKELGAGDGGILALAAKDDIKLLKAQAS